MNTITRFGATIITTASILAGAAPAMAAPHPYERGKVSPATVAKVVRHARMIPRPGSDGTNALCRSGSKAARWAC